MDARSPIAGLSTKCAKCGALHTASSFSQLKRKVLACCAPAKKRSSRSAIVRVPLPVALPVRFVFDRLTASQNLSTRAHWRVYARDRGSWRGLCAPVLAPFRNCLLAWSSWSIVREYAPPKRELDWGNLVGGCKPLIDCLVEECVIHDDAPDFFTCQYTQQRGAVNQTILTLLDSAAAKPQL